MFMRVFKFFLIAFCLCLTLVGCAPTKYESTIFDGTITSARRTIYLTPARVGKTTIYRTRHRHPCAVEFEENGEVKTVELNSHAVYLLYKDGVYDVQIERRDKYKQNKNTLQWIHKSTNYDYYNPNE